MTATCTKEQENYIEHEVQIRLHDSKFHQMTNNEKIANVVAFLSILFGEDHEALSKIMEFNPNYIIEKFERYILSARKEYSCGLHPSLRNHTFQRYVDKWQMELKDE